MNENDYQKKLLEWFSGNIPSSTFSSKLALRYQVGKYFRGKVYGMPDCELDIVETDAAHNFHLHELKLLKSAEVKSGKFYGQMMLYDFLFRTEPLNELLGRFLMHGEIVGDEQLIADAILKRETDENTTYADAEKTEIIDSKASCNFSTWSLILCGGHGYEIAAGYNPGVWSLFTFAQSYFKDNVPPFMIFHFFESDGKWWLLPIEDLSVIKHGGLPESVAKQFNADFPDWEYDE
ncbi:MAG: hypothetical protein AAFN65_10280 [Bacteroidota bacterium]